MTTKKRSQHQLLLLEDVDNLGRKGDIVSGAKPGFIRNFLLPANRAVFADNRTLRMRERLQKERAEQAAVDRKESEVLAGKLKSVAFTHVVKVDAMGHLYGSVSTQDIVHILSEQGISIERKMVLLGQPIRKLGIHHIPLRLKEDVQASFSLRVQDEHGNIEVKVETPSEEVAPATTEDAHAEEQEAAAAVDEEIAIEDAKQGE